MVCSFFLFMLLFILPVGKEIYGGNNEPTRVIPFTHTVNSSGNLSGGPAKPNTYWAVTVFYFLL